MRRDALDPLAAQSGARLTRASLSRKRVKRKTSRDMFPRVWEPESQDIPGYLRENFQDFPDIVGRSDLEVRAFSVLEMHMNTERKAAAWSDTVDLTMLARIGRGPGLSIGF
jgi:hypothetical protein